MGMEEQMEIFKKAREIVSEPARVTGKRVVGRCGRPFEEGHQEPRNDNDVFGLLRLLSQPHQLYRS